MDVMVGVFVVVSEDGFDVGEEVEGRVVEEEEEEAEEGDVAEAMNVGAAVEGRTQSTAKTDVNLNNTKTNMTSLTQSRALAVGGVYWYESVLNDRSGRVVE